MPIIICPGFHPEKLTAQFVQAIFSSPILPPVASSKESRPGFAQPLVIDAFCADPIAVFNWMTKTLGSPHAKDPVIAIGFSGGVVGLSGALTMWQQQGGKIARFIAIDGWGVPVLGVPVCRLSHDAFTHWSSLPLGAGEVNFYADPSVDHLQMWADPQTVRGLVTQGWQTGGTNMSAAEFILQVLSATGVSLLGQS